MCESLRWAIRMAAGRDGHQQGARGWAAWQDGARRGSKTSLWCKSSLGFVSPHCQGQLWEEEGFLPPEALQRLQGWLRSHLSLH